jgi:hypothetical protein
LKKQIYDKIGKKEFSNESNKKFRKHAKVPINGINEEASRENLRDKLAEYDKMENALVRFSSEMGNIRSLQIQKEGVWNYQREALEDDQEGNHDPVDVLLEKFEIAALSWLSKIDQTIYMDEFNIEVPNIYLIQDICRRNDLEELLEKLKENLQGIRNEADNKIRKAMQEKRQRLYFADAKRTFNWMIKDLTPNCDIESNRLHEHFESKWVKQEGVDKEVAENMLGLEQTIDEKMKEEFMEELYNLKKMKDVIRTRGNLSSPENDFLTNHIIKIERESSARMMVNMMKASIGAGIYPEEWKGARTILIYKGGDKMDPTN